MIKFNKISQEIPYVLFKTKYDEALSANQDNIEAILISSYNKTIDEVDSRYVNLKLVDENKFIFFTNYNSPKSKAFKSHNQISATFFWSSTNTQIRLKAKIQKTSDKFNQEYFVNRSAEKNALAISSMQSQLTTSYKEVIKKYNETYSNKNLTKCPDYWGGYSFIPYYFEFWEGHESRINKRVVFKKINTHWKKFKIQP